jgi:hypothetical protein
MLLVNLLIVLATGYAAAVAFFFARGWKRGARTVTFVLLAIVVLGSVGLFETGNAAVRFVAISLPLMIFLLHMWDLHMDPDRVRRLGLWDYIVFVGDYAWSVARVVDDYGAGLPFKRRALDAGRYVAALCLVSAVTVGAFRIDWTAYPFLVEHAVKSTCLAASGLWAFQVNTALWRLAGAPAAYLTTRSVLGAHSPAEFWRRWNRPMYRWLLENVYKPLGGRRRPLLATLAVFAVSGLLHEFQFGVAFQRVTGYPTAFFLLHGLAVVLTRRFKPTGWLIFPAAVFTFAFNTASTILLFIPISDWVPLYMNEIPTWARLW